MAKKAILMKAKDNVCTVVEEIQPGDEIVIKAGDTKETITALQAIRFGHKVARRDIAVGDTVWKYGESIGAATKAIKAGEHVHVHNVESCRGRGDKE